MPEFLDIEGEIPVSVAVRGSEIPAEFRPSGPVPACAAWDTNPPRPFDPGSALRNGTAMSEPDFWKFVSRIRAVSEAAS
jgi:hypothetical protein